MKQDTGIRISIKGFEEAVKTEQPIQVKVLIHNSLGYVNHLKILFNKHGQHTGEDLQTTLYYVEEESNYEISCFTATVQFQTPGYRTYIFELIIDGEQYFIKNDGQGGPVITREDYPFFEAFAYDKSFSTPDWAKGAIMYQIYIDTFNSVNSPQEVACTLSPWGSEPKWRPDPDGEYRNNRFFGGNLEGIIEKLPYLKTLGVTILYLTPIFKSVSSNRYDTVDYEQIDEMVGNWKILQKLYEKAHELGMYTVLDCVFNHCNPENELYKTQKDLFTGNFWWGYKHLAEFRMNSEGHRKLLRKLLNLYLEYCDGIRLDVADNLPDDTLRFIRAVIKENETRLGKQIYLLGEVWKHAIKGEWRSFLFGDELDAVMNYQFTDAILRYVRWGDFYEFKKKVFYNVLRLYPKCVIDVLMNPLSTHDIPRPRNCLTNPLMLRDTHLDGVGEVFIWDYDKLPLWTRDGVYRTEEKRSWESEASILSHEETAYADKTQKLSALMQYTLPGIPSIFAGDELGVPGLKDPFNRVCMPWEKAPDNEMKEFYIKIGEIRTHHRDVFAEGKCELVLINEKVCIYTRSSGQKIIYCIFNRSADKVQLDGTIPGHIIFSLNRSTNKVLNPYEAMIIER